MATKCRFELSDVKIDVSPGCPNGESLDSARLYIHENFYICGELPPKNGKVTAYNEQILPNQTTEVTNGHFYVEGYTDTEQHKVYYVMLNYSDSKNNTCELAQIPLEVLGNCNEVGPGSKIIEGDVIEEGKNFTIEVSSPEKNYNMTIQGISNTTRILLKKGVTWRGIFSSKQCCTSPPCSCEIKLQFVDAKHPMCKDSATLNISVKKPELVEIESTGSIITLIIIGIVIIGTGAILLLNKGE